MRMGRQLSFVVLLVFIGTCRCQDDIRLVGGSGPKEGRVEILVDGEWGTICDDLWDIKDANVVCRQLGYPGAERERDYAYFGQGSGRIWLDNVECTGDEETLADCPKNRIGDHNCQHYEDAGVECQMQDDGSVTEDVSSTNAWRDDYLCGGGYLAPNGEVAQCDPEGIYPCCSSYNRCGITADHCDCEGCIDFRVENTTTRRWRDDYQCGKFFMAPNGGVAECNPNGPNPCCSPNHWCGITPNHCDCEECINYRLIYNVDTKYREDYRCGGNFLAPNGDVAECDPEGIYPCCSPANWCGITADQCDCTECIDYRNPVTQRWRDDSQCGEGFLAPNGRVAECNPNGTNPCCSSHNWCGISPSHCECVGCIDFRIFHNGQTKYRQDTRCGGNFLGPNGEVAECDPEGRFPCCSRFNYCGIHPDYCDCTECIDYRNQGTTTQQRWRDDFRCGGDFLAPNGDIAECDPNGPNPCCSPNNWCDVTPSHCECDGCIDYRMTRYQDIRLVGGQSENEGRVEVQVNGEWGTVCDDEWDLSDAKVVCNELGYPGVEAYFTNSHFGQGTGDIWLDNVQCSGDEKSLNHCTKNRIGDHNCGHDEDAGVTCTARESTTEATSGVETEHSSTSSICEPLRSSLCQGMPYNLTSLPSGNSSQEDAEQILSLTFQLVIPMGCPAGFFQFMCLQSMPPCDSTGIPTIPCKELCVTGIKVCYEMLEASGVPIPPLDLDCSLFPAEETGLCFAEDPSGLPYYAEDPGQDYREDYRCGGDYFAPNGEVAKCKKDGQYPCCSPEKWCGITSDHCDCSGCIDYRYHD